MSPRAFDPSWPGQRRTLRVMDFVKAHATANDFVVLDDRDDELELTVALVRALCDRRRGLGADGVLRLAPPRVERHDQGDADVFMDYRNADGSVVETCGNGLRVVAKYLVDRGLDRQRVRIETRAGVRTARVDEAVDDRVRSVTVEMGVPGFVAATIPFRPRGDGGVVAAVEQVDVEEAEIEISPLSMGNPHAVLLVEDVDAAPVRRLGPRLEVHDAFPARTNVEFAEVVDRDRVRLRVWERGVGETASCGTGACAAVVALQRRGLVDREVRVEVPGGRLEVRWDRDEAGESAPGGPVWLTGPVEEIAVGRVDDDWLAAREDRSLTRTGR